MERRRHTLWFALLAVWLAAVAGACSSDAPPMGAALAVRDSVPVMVSRGVSKLISDSGVIKYKVVAEEWQYFDRTQPPRQVFPKGIFLERYDDKFKPDLYITADTAYCYNDNLWELRGRVLLRDLARQTDFRTHVLYYDMRGHRFYSRTYSRLDAPDRQLEGNRFESDDRMMRYKVWQTSGFMPMEKQEEAQPSDSLPLREKPQSVSGKARL
ncbi:MAG: LPS export ABC transporter periplasmic protein LptC [Alloprevotella sp.]